MKNIKYSIIIVHYKNEKDLIETLNSLYKYSPKNLFEVIIVDNSENTEIKKKIIKYKNIIYCNSGKNLGYGGGVNFGAKRAKGEFLFILNPDVIFTQDVLSSIYKEFNKKINLGIIAPILLNSDNSVMEQGARNVGFFEALVKFSFLDKIFPNNFISRNYWTKKWNTNLPTKVDNVPGTAFVIRKSLFKEVKGFDERFFLYFEEFDLCDKVRALGYEIYIDSRLKLIHKWGTSTKLLENKNEIFIDSRNYYFKKKFGILKSFVINLFLGINLNNLLFLLIFAVAFGLRIYKFESTINLGIGDQGWFYLSARDFIVSFSIPLVGITSSHVWLHQGAMWTYILSFIFKLFSFNPLSPVIFTVILDLSTLVLIYKFSSKMFNPIIGLFAAIIYTFSTYVIMGSRMPYHTSPIPLLTLLFIFAMFKWIKGNINYFPVVLLLLSLLYNFELQTVIFMFTSFVVFIYGLLRRKNWVTNLKNRKTIIASVAFFILPLIPVLIYDLQNGFPQTFVFGGWIFYKAYLTLTSTHSDIALFPLIHYLVNFIDKLFFVESSFLSISLLILASVYALYNTFKERYLNFSILIVIIFFLILGIFINKTFSDAYLYSLIIPLILLVAAFLGNLIKRKSFNLALLVIVLIFLFTNFKYLNSSGYYDAYKQNNKYFSKTDAAKYVVKDSNGKQVRLVGKGDGSQFESFLDYYKYLIWFYGGNIDQKSNMIYILYETPYGTKIIKGDNNVKHSSSN